MREISPFPLTQDLFQPERTVFRLRKLTLQIRDLLENRFLLVWVEEEIFQLKNHTSGHLFFSLKDEEALLKAIIFREQARELGFPLREGLKVLCFGRISVYPPRGEYRLSVRRIEPRGLGALQVAFEALKQELAVPKSGKTSGGSVSLVVLSRGYSVTRKLPEKTVIPRAKEVKVGEHLEILLEEGRLEVRVERIHPDTFC